MIPPLPGRELGGKFEEGLLEKRQQGFQTFVNRICSHPVLSNCELWMSWITITDDKVCKSFLSFSKKSLRFHKLSHQKSLYDFQAFLLVFRGGKKKREGQKKMT